MTKHTNLRESVSEVPVPRHHPPLTALVVYPIEIQHLALRPCQSAHGIINEICTGYRSMVMSFK